MAKLSLYIFICSQLAHKITGKQALALFYVFMCLVVFVLWSILKNNIDSVTHYHNKSFLLYIDIEQECDELIMSRRCCQLLTHAT